MKKKPKRGFRLNKNFAIFLLIPIIALGLFFGFRKTVSQASVNAEIEVLKVENAQLKEENDKWKKIVFDTYKTQESYRTVVKQIADLMFFTNMPVGGTSLEPAINGSDEMTVKYATQAYNSYKELLDSLYGLKDRVVIFNRYFKESPFIYPVKTSGTVKLSSAYGFREGLFVADKDKLRFHPGIDLVGKLGDEIQATANGTVAYVEYENPTYGMVVIVRHELGFETWYAHLSEIKVKSGQVVKQGDVVGLMGSSGEVTGCHLHYEIHFGEKTVDPMWFLSL